MDLTVLINASVEKLIASGAIEKAISDKIEKTVLACVTDAMGEYSDFGKVLKKSVGDALKMHGDIDLPSYNDTILKFVAKQLEGKTNAVIQREIEGRLKELLTPAPESIKLSDLVAQYIESVKSKKDAGCVCYGDQEKIFFRLSKDTSPGFTSIELDEDPKAKPGSSDIRFGVYKETIYHLAFNSRDVEKQMFVGPLYGFERMLFQMKAAKTRLIIEDGDAEYIETSYEMAHS